MSRSRRPESVKEFGGRRFPGGYPMACKATKRLTHKAERRHAEREIDESINLSLEDDKQQLEPEPHEEFYFEDYLCPDDDCYADFDDPSGDDYFFSEHF